MFENMTKSMNYKRVKELLEVSDVCRLCVLRYFGVKSYSSYTKQNIDKTLEDCLEGKDVNVTETVVQDIIFSEINGSPVKKRKTYTPCSACLGILQDLDKMVPKIENAINETQHKFQDFVLQISLPVVIELRNKLFLLYLKSELEESYPLNDNEVPSVKDICKWVIGSQFGELTKTDFTPFSEFQIHLSSSYPETMEECLILFQKCPEAFPNARKKKVPNEAIYTRAAVLKSMEELSSEIKNLYTLPPQPPKKCCVFNEVRCSHSALYLAGRYNKYSRELSQTPWIVDGKRHMESSVSELICDTVHKHILADKIIFSASGREDVDVQMLGNGRPFVLEILNPRNMKWSNDEMKAIENDINQSTELIAVKHLQVISKDDTGILKEGEQEKRKNYIAHCIVKKCLKQEDIEHLENLKDVELQQKTPIRVLHRRTLSTRVKVIHKMKGKILNDHHLLLSLETQAGTYVKEFVHSDFGRTYPSLGTILETTADILELDVEDIQLDWPPNNNL